MSWMAFLLLCFIVVGIVGYVVTLYNGLVVLRNNVDKSWANIEVLLKQRHEEIPNLVEVCKGYMKFEGTTLQNVAQARSRYSQATTVDQKAEASSELNNALGRLIATVENYPDLKANANFMQLQSRITQIQAEIADRMEFYNDSVNTFNTRIQEMPDAILAGRMGLVRRSMFHVSESEKAPVNVSFGEPVASK